MRLGLNRLSRPRTFLTVVGISLSLLMVMMFPVETDAQWLAPGGLKNGPYVDKIVYNVIQGDDQQVLALQNNEIDLIGDMVDPTHLPALEEASNIEVVGTQRNGYGYITINCAKYPYNITDFRRACAFAFDKRDVSDNAWDGLSVPQDSCVPQINPFSTEGFLSYDYYDADYATANYLLDRAGFLDVDNDTFREAPDGSDFDVVVEIAQSSNIAIESCVIFADCLKRVGIDAEAVPTDFYEYFPFDWHFDYDMVFLGTSFNNFDVDWLAYEFWSEYVDEPYYNFPNWQNATYDSWRNQLLYSVDYEEVYEAAFAMQEIWVHACPMIICYENILLSAYCTDRFQGQVNDANHGVPSWWTNYKVHLKQSYHGPWGGTFRWSNPLDLDTFNFMTSSSSYTQNVLQMIQETLLRQDSEGNLIPWLAESYTVESHADNPTVPEGNTRFTIDIIQNATWSDGSPVTGFDVAFTYNYYRDAPGHPYGIKLQDLAAAYAPSNYRVILEFIHESYWYISRLSTIPILPQHFFQDIGLEGWNTWDPQPPMESMVTCGPFNVSEYVAGEFCELTYNPNYLFGLDRDSYIPPCDSCLPTTYCIYCYTPWDTPFYSTPDPTTHSHSTPELDFHFHYLGMNLIEWGITLPSLGVIVIVLVKWRHETRS